jgi:hypothetical protein
MLMRFVPRTQFLFHILDDICSSDTIFFVPKVEEICSSNTFFVPCVDEIFILVPRVDEIVP